MADEKQQPKVVQVELAISQLVRTGYLSKLEAKAFVDIASNSEVDSIAKANNSITALALYRSIQQSRLEDKA